MTITFRITEAEFWHSQNTVTIKVVAVGHPHRFEFDISRSFGPLSKDYIMKQLARRIHDKLCGEAAAEKAKARDAARVAELINEELIIEVPHD